MHWNIEKRKKEFLLFLFSPLRSCVARSTRRKGESVRCNLYFISLSFGIRAGKQKRRKRSKSMLDLPTDALRCGTRLCLTFPADYHRKDQEKGRSLFFFPFCLTWRSVFAPTIAALRVNEVSSVFFLAAVRWVELSCIEFTVAVLSNEHCSSLKYNASRAKKKKSWTDEIR